MAAGICCMPSAGRLRRGYFGNSEVENAAHQGGGFKVAGACAV